MHSLDTLRARLIPLARFVPLALLLVGCSATPQAESPAAFRTSAQPAPIERALTHADIDRKSDHRSRDAMIPRPVAAANERAKVATLAPKAGSEGSFLRARRPFGPLPR